MSAGVAGGDQPRRGRLRRRSGALAGAAVGIGAARRVRGHRRFRSALADRLGPRAETTVRTADGVDLHVEVDGNPDAPVVVLFSHGFTARLEEFELQRAALRDRATLVFYDQRGHGRSAWGDVRRATIEQLGDDLGRVLDWTHGSVAQGRPVVLVGHSMGGMSIMSLCKHQPDRLAPGATRGIAGLGLIATSAAPEADEPLYKLVVLLRRLHLLGLYLAIVMRLAPLLESVRRRGTRGGRAVTRRLLFGRDDVRPEWLDEVQAMIEETPLTITAAFYATFLDHDDSAVLPTLGRVPVVVVVGTDDQLTPLAANERIAREAGPSAELVVEPGAGHSVNLTRSESTNAALGRLLDRVLAAGPVSRTG